MALAADKTNAIERVGKDTPYDVAGTTEIFNKGLVCRNATGYLEPAALDADFRVVGISQDYVDNSTGGDADLACVVRKGISTWLDNSATGDSGAVAITDIGEACYVFDDEAVRTYAAAGVNVRAGIVDKIDATLGVLVHIDGLDGSTVSAPADFTVGDDLTVTDDATIGGDLGVTGAATLAAACTVGTTLGVTGAATLAAAATVGTTLGVTGAATLASTLDVAGVATFTDAASVATTLDVTGNLTCADLDPTGDINMDAAAEINVAPDGVLVVPYAAVASGGAPTQGECAAAFGAAANGKVGVFADSGGVLYFCCADAALTWHYAAMTAA